jgi:hypothetical protein
MLYFQEREREKEKEKMSESEILNTYICINDTYFLIK